MSFSDIFTPFIWLSILAILLFISLAVYAWPGHWLTRHNLALLSIVPLLVTLSILTDHLHHLMWHGFDQ